MGRLLLITLSGNKQRAPACDRAQGHFPSTSPIPAAAGCCCILPAVTYSSQASVQPTAFPVLRSFPSSARGELSSSRTALQPLSTSRSWEKAQNCTLDTQPGPLPPCLVQAPHRRQQLCPCLSCQHVSKWSFQAFHRETEGGGCDAGPGCTADPPSLLSCFLPPTTQAGKNKRKQSHGKAGLIPIKATKVNVSFGCQELSSIISFFSVSNEGCGFGDFDCCVSANSSLL